ncbi:MAG: hypothetical protein ABI963_07645 [Rhizomicrobium sp.]
MKFMSLAALAGASVLIAGTALAADLGAEITNAQTHANLAAQSGTINAVHMHMHHALNCLVGPQGEGFDEKQMNPCAKVGAGAIPDSTNAGQKVKLEAAKTQLVQGIAATDLKAAQDAANGAQATIASAK